MTAINTLLVIHMMMIGVIRPLFVILPQMSGYIKYFENGGKNMSFKIEEENGCLKYAEIWKCTKYKTP